ncbi:beta-1,6-N-acetylglucosaminyltransferase [Caballeronia sp. LjRoot31]|uniref:beta-1,6-N-acetylglucosaminyltransferase n=1 Tax=Caballeronia sp. LjRoot31 TaxID=3342324 RepID=UPI003ED146DD
MRIAYLILAHSDPVQLRRLIRSLSSENAHFYVHIDKKANSNLFTSILNHSRLKFCRDRRDCVWGHISLVDATLDLIKMAIADGVQHDYFVLLSGACYPLQSVRYIEKFFSDRRGSEFIEIFKFPNVEYGKSVERLTRYWIKKDKPLISIKWGIQNLINRLSVSRDYKISLGDAEPMVGSQWWGLSRHAVVYIIDFLDKNVNFYKFCKNVDCPDEFLFQTILWNSSFREKVSHSLTFTHWLPGRRSPENIDASYLPDFRQSVIYDSRQNNCPNGKKEVLFARKFSSSKDEIMNVLDEIIFERELLLFPINLNRN